MLEFDVLLVLDSARCCLTTVWAERASTARQEFLASRQNTTAMLRVGVTPLDALGPSENWIDLNTAADAGGVLQYVEPTPDSAS